MVSDINRMAVRFSALKACLVCVLLVAGISAHAAQQWASGVIVKLKSASGPVALESRLAKPTAVRLESNTVALSRLKALSVQRQVPFASVHPTAFAAHVLRAPRLMSLEEAQAQADRLASDPSVEWAIPNVMEKPASVWLGSDPRFNEQRWLQSRDWSLKGVADFPKAWARMAGAPQPISPVVVAVLDGGVLPHPDLEGRFLPGYDFVSVIEYARDGDGLDANANDPGNWLTSTEKASNHAYDECQAHDSSWHGLAIAGMLGSNAGNDLDGRGILSPISGPVILPVRVAGNCGAEVSDIIEGMLWAAGIPYQGSPALNPYPARIINLSFGGDGSCQDSGQHDWTWIYRQTVATLRAKGVLVIASAGNGDDHGVGQAAPTRPANCPGVLAVTALHERGFKAGYANLVNAGNQPSLAVDGGDFDSWDALGSGILTTYNTGLTTPDGNGYVMESLVGTSFAAPTVVGAAALMLAVDPYLSVDELEQGLIGSASPHLSRTNAQLQGMPDLPECAAGVAMSQCYCTSLTCGAGVLDADAAVAYAIAHRTQYPNGSSSSASQSGGADYFTPSRVGSTQPAQSGGGGAMDTQFLVLLAMLTWLTFMAGGKR